MQIPAQISFRHMEANEEIEALVRAKVDKLETFGDQIIGCRVVIEPAGKHHEHGNLYSVRIDVTVPHEEIVVTRTPSERTEFRDIQVAIRDAFDAAKRQLEDYIRRRRGLVKTLESMPHARVSRLVADEDHGFLQTPEGREIYFHRNSVVNDQFDHLGVGAEVAFVEQSGEKGPQASTVRIVGKHYHG